MTKTAATLALTLAMVLGAFVIGRGTAVNDQVFREFIDQALPLVGPTGQVSELTDGLVVLRRQMGEKARNLNAIQAKLTGFEEMLATQAERIQSQAATLAAAQKGISSLLAIARNLGQLAAKMQGRIDRIEGLNVESELARFDGQVGALDAVSRQLFYKLSAIDAVLRRVTASQRSQEQAGQGGSHGLVTPSNATKDVAPVAPETRDTPDPSNASVAGVSPQLPFHVVAIDNDAGGPTVTVAEPAIAGRRRTAHLAKGESHLGWSLRKISDQRVTFTHEVSGQTKNVKVGG